MPIQHQKSHKYSKFTPQGTRTMTPKARSQEITKTRVEIETKKTIENINKTKSFLFEKINKMDKYLARLRKKKIQIKLKTKEDTFTTNTTEIQWFLQTTNNYTPTNPTTQRTSKFLDTQLNHLNHKEKNLNRLLTERRRISNQDPCNKQNSKTRWLPSTLRINTNPQTI